ncbi:glycoside hydrolase family 26 protein [Rugosimonospora africana]|uniref:GH26 domain-containing protein n=1 Tax=Rugosimonospora africana TaxID=556532 RepID=A0A8J3VSG3_9ACTN|nr:glycosyl hydrolase [Rugosimonospora africana]GIH17247.1 hypothetical protein Raf01_54190 [Rugosimonospora africana]
MRRAPAQFRLIAIVVTAALCLSAAACNGGRQQEWSFRAANPPTSSPSPAGPVVAKVDDVLPGDGPVFGVYTPDRSAAGLATVAAKVGCRPALQEVFGSVMDGVSVATLRGVAGTPMLSLEPWVSTGGKKQPDWSLEATIDGDWDKQYEAVARSVVEYQQPLLIRFAHEMNGNWYPWGVANGNQSGQYVAAWKHVVDLFRKAGATNALWVWSPNIIRGASSRTLKPFWPGDSYVDVVGLTGYGVREANPDTTYKATLTLIHALTKKPIVLTEVGVQKGTDKRSWISGFGSWLLRNPQIAGFVWNEVTRDGDWRYDDNSGDLSAFKASLKTAKVSC